MYARATLDPHPPDAAPRFGDRTDHPATQAALLAELKSHYADEWPRIWGILWGHREACLLAALSSLDAALADPKVTRQGLRRRMVAALEAIAARGPEPITAPPP